MGIFLFEGYFNGVLNARPKVFIYLELLSQLVDKIICEQSDTLMDVFMETLSEQGQRIIIQRLPQLLIKASENNKFNFFEWSVALLKKFNALSEHLRVVTPEGDTVLTSLCRNPNVDIEIIRLVLSHGLPEELLLHQKEGKNALDWVRVNENSEAEQLLLSDERRSLFLIPLEEQKRKRKYCS